MKHVASVPALEGPVRRSEVCHMMEDALNRLNDRSDALVTKKTDKSMIGIMESLDDSRDMVFVRG